MIKYAAQPLSAVSAASNQTSDWIACTTSVYGSFQITWASLTGTLDGVVTIECSNDKTNAVAKSGATLTLSSASGSDEISLNGVLTGAWVRVKYTKNNCSGGTVTCDLVLKG